VGISDDSIRPKEGSFCSKAATACYRLSTETLSKKANERLEKLGVKVVTGAKVEKVDDQGVIAGGKRILRSTFDSRHSSTCAAASSGRRAITRN
jgi:hypothetical protein